MPVPWIRDYFKGHVMSVMIPGDLFFGDFARRLATGFLLPYAKRLIWCWHRALKDRGFVSWEIFEEPGQYWHPLGIYACGVAIVCQI